MKSSSLRPRALSCSWLPRSAKSFTQYFLPSPTRRTGRVQTCTSDANPFFYNLCLEIDKLREGPPVLLNTSFNVAGQPIVETPEEAIATFLRTDIDYLALENKWIRRRHEPVKSYESHVKDLPKEAMPHGLEPEQPSVRPLMDELDAALFHGAESSHWTHDEIQELAAEGGKFKETSRLYPDSGYLGTLQTQIAKILSSCSIPRVHPYWSIRPSVSPLSRWTKARYSSSSPCSITPERSARATPNLGLDAIRAPSKNR